MIPCFNPKDLLHIEVNLQGQVVTSEGEVMFEDPFIARELHRLTTEPVLFVGSHAARNRRFAFNQRLIFMVDMAIAARELKYGKFDEVERNNVRRVMIDNLMGQLSARLRGSNDSQD